MAACRTKDPDQQRHHFSYSSAGELAVQSPRLRALSSCSALSTQFTAISYSPQQSLETLHLYSLQIPQGCMDRSLKLHHDFYPGQPSGERSLASSPILPSARKFKDDRTFPCQRVAMKRGSWVLEAGTDGEQVDFSRATSQEILTGNAVAALKSHSEAEKRRRERINKHLATLRDLLPSSTKTDKASLLADVIAHIKELKRQAGASLEEGFLPSDTDQQSVEVDFSQRDKRSVIRVSISCDDRPYLLSEFTQTLRTLRLKLVRAEIVTLAGRMKNVFLMTCEEDDKETNENSPSASHVQEALKSVLERSISVNFLSRKLNKH